MKRSITILVAGIMALASPANALSPPLIRKSLSERVALSTHVVVATAKAVRVVKIRDGRTTYVEPTPSQLDLETGTEIELQVDKVLHPPSFTANGTIKYRFGGGLFDVSRITQDVLNTPRVYLLVKYKDNDQELYGPSYGWHLFEVLDSMSEIIGYIEESKQQ